MDVELPTLSIYVDGITLECSHILIIQSWPNAKSVHIVPVLLSSVNYIHSVIRKETKAMPMI
jgi:hypothetical protein